MIVHDEYMDNEENNNYHYNDIALVILDWKVSGGRNMNIGPVCLPIEDQEKEMDLEGKTLTVAGFGEKFNDFCSNLI